MRSTDSVRAGGAVVAVLGFAVMVLAWAWALAEGFPPSTLPAAFAGGLAGMALVVAGMAVEAVVALRTSTARRAGEMARVQHELDSLLRGLVRPGPGEVVEDVTFIDVAARTVERRVERKPQVAPPGAAPAGAVPAPPAEPRPAATAGPVPAEPRHAATAEPVAAEPGPPSAARPAPGDRAADAAGGWAAEESPWAPPRPEPADSPGTQSPSPQSPSTQSPSPQSPSPQSPSPQSPSPQSPGPQSPTPQSPSPEAAPATMALPEVPTLGAAERAAVTERFPSAAALRAASLEQLREAGLTEIQARQLQDALR